VTGQLDEREMAGRNGKEHSMPTDSAHRRTVLVAVDDRPPSERVVSFVNFFFAGLEVQVIGLNVGSRRVAWMPQSAGLGGPFYWPLVNSPPDPSGEDLDRAIDEAARTVEASGLEEDEVVAELGDPVTQICDTAIERAADLIVVGDSHKGVWQRLLEGSTVDEVRRQAPCPVLVVP
jgi:nucleotide-binding universal stress UspA family protein